MLNGWLLLTTERRIDAEIYYALTSLKLGNSSLVKPEDLISSEPPSDLETAVYHQKKECQYKPDYDIYISS